MRLLRFQGPILQRPVWELCKPILVCEILINWLCKGINAHIFVLHAAVMTSTGHGQAERYVWNIIDIPYCSELFSEPYNMIIDS